MTTSIFVFISGQKNDINGTLIRQTFGAMDLKHGMHTKLHFESKMGGVPPGYTFSHCYDEFFLYLRTLVYRMVYTD